MAGVVLKRPTCIGNGVNGQDPCNHQRADAKLELNYIILTNFATKLNPSNSNSYRWGSPQQFCLPTSDRMWGSPQHFVRRFVGQVLAWLDEEWSGKPLGRDWTIVSILFRFGGRCLCLGEGITSLTHRVCGFLFGFLSAKPAPQKNVAPKSKRVLRVLKRQAAQPTGRETWGERRVYPSRVRFLMLS